VDTETDRIRMLRHGAVAALGIATYIVVLATAEAGMAMMLLAVVGGLAAAMLLPRWTGWAVFQLALAATVIAHAVTLEFAGLWPLALAILAVLSTGGWLAGYAFVTVVEIGVQRGLRDRRVLGAVAGVVAIVALVVVVMALFSSDPP
jgi:hypothetical protein